MLYAYQSHLLESNLRPTDYKSVALPAELRWLIYVTYFTKILSSPPFQQKRAVEYYAYICDKTQY